MVLPRALHVVMPLLFSNQTLNLKGTSLAGLVAVPELIATISGLISETYRPTEVLLLASAVYPPLNSVIIGIQGVVERCPSSEGREERAEDTAIRAKMCA